MTAMFSQNPVMNGPNYSLSDAPTTANGGHREHRFNPYVHSPGTMLSMALTIN